MSTTSLDDLLTVDLGNSTTDCLAHATGRRVRFDAACSPEPVVAFARGASIQRVVLASVRRERGDVVAAALREAGFPVAVAGTDLPCPLTIDYEPPESLGTDRWLGALAAHRERGAGVVVDCGSATTVNVVDDRGVFRGGVIAPGFRALVAGMLAVTPSLPLPPLAVPSPTGGTALPRRTLDALLQGRLVGYCGLVERLAADAMAIAARSSTLWITGGNAGLVLASTRLAFVHADDLVHRGLRWLVSERP